ncbi:MAG: hypothetical protein ACI8WB_003655 [Phenylobacterium sp.]|jgi:uncharacterized protein (DUF697 family)
MTDKKSDQAIKIVNNYIKGTVAIGLVPMPLLDSLAISAAQLKMLHSLAKLYELEFSDSRGKSVLASLLGSTLPLSLKINLFSLCKGIPVLGQAVGMLGLPVLAGAATYAIGHVFIQHFESGGTLLDFDPEKVREYYQQQLHRGKEVVRESFIGVRP